MTYRPYIWMADDDQDAHVRDWQQIQKSASLRSDQAPALSQFNSICSYCSNVHDTRVACPQYVAVWQRRVDRSLSVQLVLQASESSLRGLAALTHQPQLIRTAYTNDRRDMCSHLRSAAALAPRAIR